MQRVRKCSNSVAPDAGTCHFGNSAASRTRGRPQVSAAFFSSGGKEPRNILQLFVENKHAGLAGKTNFFHLPAFTDEHRVVSRLGTAVFQRPSDSATTSLPFCTVALFPSICNRYSPAFKSALPSLAACAMLMVLEMGFAKSGTAKAMVASKAILRRNEFDLMRVNSFRSGSSQL